MLFRKRRVVCTYIAQLIELGRGMFMLREFLCIQLNIYFLRHYSDGDDGVAMLLLYSSQGVA